MMAAIVKSIDEMFGFSDGYNSSEDALMPSYDDEASTEGLSFLKLGRNSTNMDMEAILKALDDWKSRLPKDDDVGDYCTGNIRDTVTSYNNIHGYISLLVRVNRPSSNFFNASGFRPSRAFLVIVSIYGEGKVKSQKSKWANLMYTIL